MANVIGLNHLPTQMMNLWGWGCSQTQRTLGWTWAPGDLVAATCFLVTKEKKASVDRVPLVLAPTDFKHNIQLKVSSQMMSGLGRNCILSIICGQQSILDFFLCVCLLSFPRSISQEAWLKGYKTCIFHLSMNSVKSPNHGKEITFSQTTSDSDHLQCTTSSSRRHWHI